MKRARVLIFAVVLSAIPSFSQVETLNIPAGSPEDKDLTAITSEQDNQKKISMYQDYLQKYSANQTAVAYANWQLAQLYQTSGDLPKALETGDKAATAAPHNLDILTSLSPWLSNLKIVLQCSSIRSPVAKSTTLLIRNLSLRT
jgi:hypothetical protein